MHFLGHKHSQQEGAEAQPRRSSVRDLQARAYAKWVMETSIPRKHHTSSFEAERARRHSVAEDQELVMRT
ncbi:hypothetical protein PV08_05469 [Exophiala spinifera]|uniref:Uncharacterized protein n=1 Tax=Exophiala spinifera TaxID=91928 RepID=A0A0D2B943_9EURO|nr:uncharacterized protein PV08_05469 [Exophiala spinifera]KIW15423.1 hypothetical protein PV08_05469 [Exophiala spinifera]